MDFKRATLSQDFNMPNLKKSGSNKSDNKQDNKKGNKKEEKEKSFFASLATPENIKMGLTMLPKKAKYYIGLFVGVVLIGAGTIMYWLYLLIKMLVLMCL